MFPIKSLWFLYSEFINLNVTITSIWKRNRALNYRLQKLVHTLTALSIDFEVVFIDLHYNRYVLIGIRTFFQLFKS